MDKREMPLVGETVVLNLNTYEELNEKIRFLSYVLNDFVFKTKVVIAEDDTLIIDISKEDIKKWINEVPNEVWEANATGSAKKIINIKD